MQSFNLISLASLALVTSAQSSAQGTDCNWNGIPDAQDIASGTSFDCDGNAEPDECAAASFAFLEQDFDSVTNLPVGVVESFGGLWHTGSPCRPAGACGAGDFAYFGVDGSCNFDTGLSWVSGGYELQGVSLPAMASIELRFCSYYNGEGGDNWIFGTDLALVRVRTQGLGYQDIDFVSASATQSTWEELSYDLSSFAGQVVDLAFYFNPTDESFNQFFGWGVDDIRLIVPGAGSQVDCDRDGVEDACQIAAMPSLDIDNDGVLDQCECSIQSYCSAAPNSVGAGAQIGMLGSVSIGANDLVLRTIGLPAAQFGVFFFGPNATELPFGNGFRCVAGPNHRLAPVQSAANGVASFAFDNMSPVHDPGDHVFPGVRHNFQYWYRDPAAGGAGFNLSNGLELNFCP